MHASLTWNCRVCVGVIFLFAVRMLAKPYHLGVNWPTTHCGINDGIHCFTLNFECHNRYNKLLLGNSENSDIAWWNKNNSECFFSVFFEKRTKSSFFKKKKRVFLRKPQKNGFFSTLPVGCCVVVIQPRLIKESLVQNSFVQLVSFLTIRNKLTNFM